MKPETNQTRTLRTFNHWSSLGYKIKKGTKAQWVDNKPLFDETQVTRTTVIKRKPSRVVTSSRPGPPSDIGTDVCNSQGSVIGTRNYTRFNSDEWVATTEHDDGSTTVHCGGPCGDMYVDEFGNT